MVTVGYRPQKMHFPRIFRQMSPESLPWGKTVTLLSDYQEIGGSKG